MEQIAFFILAVLAVASALVVLTHRNEVICALALAFNLASIAGFYFLLGAQFIGFLQIIVYAGAIMVLIVFVVMLLNLGEESYAPSGGRIQRVLAPVLAVLFAVILASVLWRSDRAASLGPAPAGFGTVETLGHDLFSRFFYPFEVISLLLVAAMIGAVLMAKRKL
jgi:NADH-quinone oxidoreductase subunit J